VKKTRSWGCALALALVLWPVAPAGAAGRCYPSERFQVLDGDLLVRDRLTKLVWQRQASAATMTWSEAQTYCAAAGSGFRLPTVKELSSIVDLTVTTGPRIDRTAFPSTPSESFWTSSSDAASAGRVWIVSFAAGWLGPNDTGIDYRVRCVH
jgi:hypothetical protein